MGNFILYLRVATGRSSEYKELRLLLYLEYGTKYYKGCKLLRAGLASAALVPKLP